MSSRSTVEPAWRVEILSAGTLVRTHVLHFEASATLVAARWIGELEETSAWPWEVRLHGPRGRVAVTRGQASYEPPSPRQAPMAGEARGLPALPRKFVSR
jgi:hypothetical protein